MGEARSIVVCEGNIFQVSGALLSIQIDVSFYFLWVLVFIG